MPIYKIQTEQQVKHKLLSVKVVYQLKTLEYWGESQAIFDQKPNAFIFLI